MPRALDHRRHAVGRRRFLAMAGAGAGALTAGGLYAWRIEPHWIELVEQPLPVRGLPPGLVGRTIVQLSDPHVGRLVDDDYLLTAFDRVRVLEPDIVVLTGDFISYHDRIFEHAERVYRQLPHGRLATLGVLGNHDYGEGWAEPAIADQMAAVLTRCGVDLLRNSGTAVQGLRVVGLDDFWSPNFAPAPTLAGLRAGEPAIVLSHNPDSVDQPGWGEFDGWILSGHTHGGQCKPPFLPPPLLPVQNRRYVAGVYELSRDRRLYINRGLGHLLQVRFNARPEITRFTLTEAT